MIETGLDQLENSDFKVLQNKKVALLAHPASINKKKEHILKLFHQNKINLTQLFGPEHGLLGEAQDMEAVASGTDKLTGLPVRSLYGSTEASLKPQEEDFKNIDSIVCDLQDVGARYYTYIYTIAFCMELAAQMNKEVIVLDRPNPINGVDIEGNLINSGFESFVGAYSIPNRHAMTVGELALYFNKYENINCNLKVIPMNNWKRSLYFDQTNLPWVYPSPNMRTLEAALIYPGMCLIEATEISEARGTDRPFEWIGAPFINGEELSKTMNNCQLPGLSFKPVQFKPSFQKCANEVCHGVEIIVSEREKMQATLTGLVLIAVIKKLYPEHFQWREKPYEFVEDIPAIDLLTGNTDFRKTLESDYEISDILKKFDYETPKDFLKKRRDVLLYE